MPESCKIIILRQSLFDMDKIIARKREQQELEKLYYDGRPEFVVVYGRRRVGTSREDFSDQGIFQGQAVVLSHGVVSV